MAYIEELSTFWHCNILPSGRFALILPERFVSPEQVWLQDVSTFHLWLD